MITGLKVWDRQGNLLTDITGRYPKFVGQMTITADTTQTITYTPPQGTTLLVVPVYLGRNDTSTQTATATDENEHDAYTYNVWQASIEKKDSGFVVKAKAKNHENRIPIKIYWGYL